MKNEVKHKLSISFENITEEHVGKTIYIGFWKGKSPDFPKEGTIDFGEMLKIKSQNPTFSKKLAADTYAFSAYIDTNGNGKLDKNLFGIPTEPYCFSNNFTPKFSKPGFEDCSFEHHKNQDFNIKMIK